MQVYLFWLVGFMAVAFIVMVLFDHFVCWLADQVRAITGFENLSKRLDRMEKTLEEIRDQPKQEKLRQEFEKAHDLTLNEVRLLKKGDTIGLIVNRIGDLAHPFRYFQYKHDHLDEEKKVFLKGAPNLAAHTAHGFCSWYEYEQEQMLEKKNVVPLPPEQEWAAYEFLVGDNHSKTHRQEHVKCLFGNLN